MGNKVLIVDDESAIRTVVSKFLSLKDYHPIEAANGAEAINILSGEQEIDCVILDLSMPGMSGEEVYNKIREIRPELPIIIASGYISQSQSEYLIDKGAKAILQKPFNFEELIAELP